MTLSIADSHRLPQGCATGQVAEAGTGDPWVCAVDDDTLFEAGSGLSRTGTEFSVLFGDSGAATRAARSDHDHDGAYAPLGHEHGHGSPPAAHKFWVSPEWSVLEGGATTRVTALNLGTEEVEVVFNFFDRDGTLNSTFTTTRVLPAGASIEVALSDRGVTSPVFGWFAATASGPILLDGERVFVRSDGLTERTMPFHPVGCTSDPASWAGTGAPWLCSYIARELSRLL